MIESLHGPRPTDFSLGRHYDSLVAAVIGECSSDQKAMEQLICNYKGHTKTLAGQIQKTQAVAKPLTKSENKPEDSVVQNKGQKPLEDSTLQQQTINLSGLPPRPTDSVLRRHYDTMVNAEINSLLDHK